MESLQTADLVRLELEKDIFILEPLYEGLINYTALARKLLPKIQEKNKKATVESISVAVKRHVWNTESKNIDKKLKKIISKSQLSMKDNIVHLTFPRNQIVVNNINAASQKIRWDLDEICLINQGAGEITVIIDKSNLNLFKDYDDKKGKLAVLTIKESPIKQKDKGIDVPGLYAYFINQLSKRGINIIEIISTSSQVSFIIEEKDLTNSYSIIKECVEYCKQ